jgi:anti-sigma factor RsiW
MKAFWRRRLACQDVVELVTDYLEGALARSDRFRFEVHLSGCPDCTEYLRQMRMTIAVTRRLAYHRPARLTVPGGCCQGGAPVRSAPARRT